MCTVHFPELRIPDSSYNPKSSRRVPMATTQPSIPASGRSEFRLRPKQLIFTVIGAMMLIVVHENEYFLLDRAAPIWEHYEPFKWWLLIHGTFGATALFLGVLQFSDRLRQRYLRFHRIAGRFYVLGVMVAAPLGILIQRIAYVPGWVPLAGMDAALWITTTAVGLAYAVRRDLTRHKQWMTRSYAVALVFLEGRVWFAIDPTFDNLAAVWICLAAAIPVADLLLAGEEILRKRAANRLAAARAQVTANV
jgi:uncharacterized membrane protein